MPTPRPVFIARNRLRTCGAKCCVRTRHQTQRYCCNHAHRAMTYGSAESGPLPSETMQGYRAMALEAVSSYKETTQVIEAIKELRKYIYTRGHPKDYLQREMRRLRSKGADPEAILVSLVAVWVYATTDRRAFYNDRAETFALGRCLLCSAPGNYAKTSGGNARLIRFGARATLDIGIYVRQTFSIFLTNLTTAILANDTNKVRNQDLIGKPFLPGVPVVAKPSRGTHVSYRTDL